MVYQQLFGPPNQAPAGTSDSPASGFISHRFPRQCSAGFNGAVGSYTIERDRRSQQTLRGDPITLRVQISGHGALDSLGCPTESEWKTSKSIRPLQK